MAAVFGATYPNLDFGLAGVGSRVDVRVEDSESFVAAEAFAVRLLGELSSDDLSGCGVGSLLESSTSPGASSPSFVSECSLSALGTAPPSCWVTVEPSPLSTPSTVDGLTSVASAVSIFTRFELMSLKLSRRHEVHRVKLTTKSPFDKKEREFENSNRCFDATATWYDVRSFDRSIVRSFVWFSFAVYLQYHQQSYSRRNRPTTISVAISHPY